jgi:proline iminopeptidase
MTMNAKRRRVHDKLAALPGVRPVRRPVSPGSADEFDLYYVRTGRRSAHPLVIIPGGPGVASVQMYQRLRRRATATGLDVTSPRPGRGNTRNSGRYNRFRRRTV